MTSQDASIISLIRGVSPGYFEMHNGWREINGERRTGYTVTIVVPGRSAEVFHENPCVAIKAACERCGIEPDDHDDDMEIWMNTEGRE